MNLFRRSLINRSIKNYRYLARIYVYVYLKIQLNVNLVQVLRDQNFRYFKIFEFSYLVRGRRGRDRMVVGFTTTYAIIAYHH